LAAESRLENAQGPQALFVYYKIEQEQHDVLLAKAVDFVGALKRRFPLLDVQLMKRPQASAQGVETWMEVYRHPQGVDKAIMLSIGQLAVARGMPEPRLSEVFVPLLG
jgi:aspartyl/asparaginyl beta-hydroxylase (cupin superfamily)